MQTTTPVVPLERALFNGDTIGHHSWRAPSYFSFPTQFNIVRAKMKYKNMNKMPIHPENEKNQIPNL